MSDKDKWKTFPCKSCLLKGNCNTKCFNWPLEMNSDMTRKYIKENNLSNICLACGNKDLPSIQLSCNECAIPYTSFECMF